MLAQEQLQGLAEACDAEILFDTNYVLDLYEAGESNLRLLAELSETNPVTLTRQTDRELERRVYVFRDLPGNARNFYRKIASQSGGVVGVQPIPDEEATLRYLWLRYCRNEQRMEELKEINGILDGADGGLLVKAMRNAAEQRPTIIFSSDRHLRILGERLREEYNVPVAVLGFYD
jgi:hypothetical protein